MIKYGLDTVDVVNAVYRAVARNVNDHKNAIITCR